MGRTNPTFRDTLTALERRWDDYRRALRRRDQPHFDRLFTHAREHADASGLLNHQNPMDPVLVSIALEQQRAIERLQSRVDTLEATVESVPDDPTGRSDC
ncbi:hypothetical protein HZS55_21275 [Halosimplex rubrum]|uniref:DUF8156 domain-containing protein n=1 Tax=Halosimplex rubrum TaxID=869889 RepID=A0A7D5T6P0_9EURY|nr:hypothetical protein [Halosimplex rubrum]QLH79670.1 hypothetical protein HZS55_21275 [Halosimplex rubrum]